MPRGQAWTQEEVSTLLALVGASEEAALLMASTSRPNKALWQEISRGLAVAGYVRSVAQCRGKWKALKQAFHSERETHRRAAQHAFHLTPHYRAMKTIWKAAGRPVFGERKMPDLVKLPPRKRRSALVTSSSSSPEISEYSISVDTSGLLSPLLQCAKGKLKSSVGGDHIAGMSPAPFTVPRSHTALKQKSADQKTGFPGETSPGMERGNQVLPVVITAPGSPGTAAMSEQPAVGEEASDISLHGPGMAGLLQSVQQLLVQILQTSQQQQALLESLAHDTVFHLRSLSRSLVQVGETLHQLLVQPQTDPGPLGHCIPHTPVYEGGLGVPCSHGTPLTSLDHKEQPQMSPAASCTSP